MAEYEDLIDKLKKFNDEIRSQIDGNCGENTTAELIDKLRELRERADETNRRQIPPKR